MHGCALQIAPMTIERASPRGGTPHPANRTAFERLQSIVGSLRHDRARADVRAIRDEALRAVAARRYGKRLWGTLVAGAAVLTIAGVFWTTPAADNVRSTFTELVAHLTGTRTYATNVGQRSTFALDDGSSVELDAESLINVKFSDRGRDVELVRGQVLFNAARDPHRPFIVHAGNRTIVAIGTEFDVRLDRRSVQVTLIEGDSPRRE